LSSQANVEFLNLFDISVCTTVITIKPLLYSQNDNILHLAFRHPFDLACDKSVTSKQGAIFAIVYNSLFANKPFKECYFIKPHLQG